MIMTLLDMGSVKMDDMCDQNLSGEYVGFDIKLSLNGSVQIYEPVTITGSDGPYYFSFSIHNGIAPGSIGQDGCEFKYANGSDGTKRTGYFSFDGDTLSCSISGDGFKVLPFSFKGMRK